MATPICSECRYYSKISPVFGTCKVDPPESLIKSVVTSKAGNGTKATYEYRSYYPVVQNDSIACRLFSPTPPIFDMLKVDSAATTA